MKANRIYDAELSWFLTYRCNLNCKYCFNNLLKISSEASNINISALIKILNETNKIFRINLKGGGEPFLIQNLVEACVEITKSHFISLTTDLISDKIKEFTEKIDPDRVFFITAALHIKEYERLNLLDKFIYHFQLCKRKGFKIKTMVIAYPPLLNDIKKYKKIFQENEIQLKFFPFIGEYNGKNYPYSYTEKELNIFGLDLKRFYQKERICNAGYNVGMVNPNGYITYCQKIHKPIGNIYNKIKFNDKIIRCPFEFCEFSRDKSLFKKAIKEDNLKIMSSIFIEKYVLKEYLRKVLRKFLTYEKREKIVIYFRKHGITRFSF